MQLYIDDYLKDHMLAWSPSTLKSEEARLKKLAPLLSLSPDRIHHELSLSYAPYSIVTIWTRLIHFQDWLLSKGLAKGDNLFRQFRTKNKRLFKNAYTRHQPKHSFEEAKRMIENISPEMREKALQLLMGGLRFTESLSVRDGKVKGKGSKVRDVFVGHVPFEKSYTAFYRALRGVGLKPHDLRKLFATRLVREGVDMFTLCEVMGWNHLSTAQSYVQSLEKDKIKKLVKRF